MRSAHAQDESRVSPLQRGLNPCMQWRLLLAYAERHRWACGGMGAVSTQIKLWVGGPIAIHHAGTYRACQTLTVETHQGWIAVVRVDSGAYSALLAT